MRTHHVTFATPAYLRSARELERSALRFGLHTAIYTPESPALAPLYRDYPQKMSPPRGAGYWRWKPWVILDALSNASEGDVVMYTDAAVHIIADPSPLFRLALERPIVLFEHGREQGSPPTTLQANWTKRDCFVAMGSDGPQFWYANQLLGGFQIYRVCDESRRFLQDLALSLLDDRVATDDPNRCGLPNLDGFRDHRHDQSALTNLAIKAGIVPFQDPSQFGVRYEGEAFATTFYLHRRRRVGLAERVRNRFALFARRLQERTTQRLSRRGF